MAQRLLVIGNKNYSSWSLRPWLALRHLGLDFQEELVPLDRPDSKVRIARFSPSGRVPALIEDGLPVWDSLAIIEHLNDRNGGIWPSDPAARAMARSVAAEMHAGFAALRDELPMNVRAQGRKVAPSDACRADIARIVAIWEETRSRFGAGGDWLFGGFGGADAMFAPVATRFRTYGIELPELARRYRDTVLDDPAMREWVAAAEAEPMVIEHEEAGR